MNRGEIWAVELPFQSGREQRGIRPCIILANTHVNLIIIIPLTSNKQALRFPHTFEISPSAENGLDQDSIALTFHIQSLDKNRFLYQIGKLESSLFRRLEMILKSFLFSTSSTTDH